MLIEEYEMITTELFTDYKRSSCRTGNLLLSGLSNMGAEGCLLQLLKETLTEKMPVFYFDDHITRERLELIRNTSATYGYRIYAVNNRVCSCIPFNMLDLFEFPEEKAEAIYAFLFEETDSSDTVNQICRYLTDCIISLKEEKSSTIKDVFRLSVETVRKNLLSGKRLADGEMLDEISFLESHDIYKIWGLINDRSKKLVSCGLIDVLSGDRNPYDIFDRNSILLVSKSIDTTDISQTFPHIQNGFLNILAKICERRNSIRKVYHVFINNCDKIRTNQLCTMLNVGMNSSTPIPVCIYEQNVTKMFSIHSAEIFDYFRVFCVFNTNEGSFWSEFFGTMLTPDRTETYTRRKSSIYVNAGGVIPQRRAKYEATTVHRIEKPLYEARVFQALKEKSMIFYNVYTNKKTRKQLYW